MAKLAVTDRKMTKQHEIGNNRSYAETNHDGKTANKYTKGNKEIIQFPQQPVEKTRDEIIYKIAERNEESTKKKRKRKQE